MCVNTQSAGRVSFVGAGPGADDLITVRGARRIAEADLVLWPAAAIPAEVVRGHSPAAELVDCSRLSSQEQLVLYRRAAAQRLTVVRLVVGDPSMGSGLQPQFDACRRLGLVVEVVPGVGALSAVLAAAGRELAEPVVLLAQPDTVPAADAVAVAVTVSAARTESLVGQLRAGGHRDDTAVLIGYRPSRSDELVLHTTVGELEHTVKRHRLWLPALFLVGGSAPSRRNGTAPTSTAPHSTAPHSTAPHSTAPHSTGSSGQAGTGATAEPPGTAGLDREPPRRTYRRRRNRQKVT